MDDGSFSLTMMLCVFLWTLHSCNHTNDIVKAINGIEVRCPPPAESIQKEYENEVK